MNRRTQCLIALALTCSSACSEEAIDATDASTPDAGDAGEACPAPSLVPTLHAGGDLTRDEVWTAAGSPHVLQSTLYVSAGAKLTVEPCAVVRIAPDAKLIVEDDTRGGTLDARGTALRPIRFEGLNGRWGQLLVRAPGTATLAHTTLVEGGGGDAKNGSTLRAVGDGELPSDPILTVDHVTVRGAVRLDQAATFAAGSTALTISESSSYPLEVGELALGSIPSGSYTGNAIDSILIDVQVVSGQPGVQESATLHDRGVPYQVGLEDDFDDLIVGSPDGATPATLTIEPGVTLKFRAGTVLEVMHHVGTERPSNGVLRALGSADKPVVFTSARPTPAAGDWQGLWFDGVAQAANKLDHVRIEYTGADCGCSFVTCTRDVSEYEGAILLEEPPYGAFLTNSVIAHGSGHGVVQGYDGSAFDWTSSNTFAELAGCVTTSPRELGGQCTAEPACAK
ncbi:MAG: hypothetical protein ABW352_16385 [Polyangiales bacterium]